MNTSILKTLYFLKRCRIFDDMAIHYCILPLEPWQPILPYSKGLYRPEEPLDTISAAISLEREDKAKAAKAVSKWIRQTSSVFKVRLLNCRSKRISKTIYEQRLAIPKQDKKVLKRFVFCPNLKKDFDLMGFF